MYTELINAACITLCTALALYAFVMRSWIAALLMIALIFVFLWLKLIFVL